MVKYDIKFKQKLVQAYLNGEGGYDYLAKKYNVSSSTALRIWVASYREFGNDGLLRSRKNKNYSFQFKLYVVEFTSEKTARIVHSLRGEFKLKDILAVVGFPESTYMHWQKRFDRENPDKSLEEEITKIHIENKDYGYRRVHQELRNRKIFVIKKLYLDPFLDMFNDEIISYGISKAPSAASILSAQKQAMEITPDCP